MPPLAVPPPPANNPFADDERLYRHPDGRLLPTKPPPNPYTVARGPPRAR